MARFFRPRRQQAKPAPVIGSDDYVDVLSKEFHLSKDAILTIFRGLGFNTEHVPADQKDLLGEILACRTHDLTRYQSSDQEYLDKLDIVLRSFDEIYIDTAPIIQMDWFLHFVADAEPILKRRKKKLLILEKTMEELHGLKDNPEKDREVRVRAAIRPDLIRNLAKRGVVRIGDTGSTGIADDHLVLLFSRIGKNENLLLVTQDRGLSERIVRLAHQLLITKEEPLPQGFWAKLRHQEPVYPAKHTMVVCKLVEGGSLKRCYICPDCEESYYDDYFECDGILPCSDCIKKRKAKDEKEQDKQKQEQAKVAYQEALKERPTVAKRMLAKKRKIIIASVVAALAIIAVVLAIVL